MQMLGLDSGLKPMAIMPDVKVCPTDAVWPLQCNVIAHINCHLACRSSSAMLYLPSWRSCRWHQQRPIAAQHAIKGGLSGGHVPVSICI